MAKIKTFSTEQVDKQKIKELQERIDGNGTMIEDISNNLVQGYCQQLDNYIAFIKDILADEQNPPTDKELDDFVLNIPVLLYFAGEGQESLGIREDVAKAIRQELYNQAFDNATGTVADKTALAELATQNETITHIAYTRAYKKIKGKCEMANEVLQSVKKIITRRIAEYEVTRVSAERVGGVQWQQS